MTEYIDPEFENRIRNLARAFPYPSTPSVVGRKSTGLRERAFPGRFARTPAWVAMLALIVLVFAGLMAVPPVRAAVIEFIQIGVLRIFDQEEIPPLLTPEASPTNSTPAYQTPTPRPLSSLLSLAGETSLEEARAQVPVPIPLPTYPTDLGEPDKVYYQTLEGGWGVFLVWLDPEQPEYVRLSLLVMGPGAFAGKNAPDQVTNVTVNGARAVWLEGDHYLLLQTGPNSYDAMRFFVRGNVLAWEKEGITYRLESDFSLEEAIRVAEGLK
ncbi:MAG: hypothetical protein Fur0022_35230 [Anaerolineales bacterium]